MAIIKHLFYSGGLDTTYNNFVNFMEENTADYFDEITTSTGGVTCRIGGIDFVKWTYLNGVSSYSTRLVITTSAGATSGEFCGLSNTDSSASDYPICAYVCTNGIIIETRYGFFGITKTKYGKTAIIVPTNKSGSGTLRYSKNTPNLMRVVTETDVVIEDLAFSRSQTSTTSFTPIPIHDVSGDCLENALMMMYYQYRDVGNIIMGGNSYLSCGFFVIKDE